MAIKNKLNRTDLIKKLGEYPTGNICNAHSKVRAMDIRIAALSPGMKLAGPAKTAAIIPGQNAAIHRAIHNSRRGDILVVDGKKSLSYHSYRKTEFKNIFGKSLNSKKRNNNTHNNNTQKNNNTRKSINTQNSK